VAATGTETLPGFNCAAAAPTIKVTKVKDNMMKEGEFEGFQKELPAKFASELNSDLRWITTV